jgi:hypothetical protein
VRSKRCANAASHRNAVPDEIRFFDIVKNAPGRSGAEPKGTSNRRHYRRSYV